MKHLSLSIIRKRSGKTQAEVADEMRVSQSAISKIESGRDVSLAQLREYIAALGGELIVSARIGGTALPIAVSDVQYGQRAATRRVSERASRWQPQGVAPTSDAGELSQVVAPEWLDEVDRIRAMTPRTRLQELANGAAFFAAAKRVN